MYPSIFNRFPVIQPLSSKVRHFSTFFAHFGLPVRPLDNCSKCYMNGKRIKCWSNASLYIPIYLQPFLRYSKLLVENCDIFIPHLCLKPKRMKLQSPNLPQDSIVHHESMSTNSQVTESQSAKISSGRRECIYTSIECPLPTL